MAIHFQHVQRPDLGPLALLVRKFGTKIEGGGFEVVITPADSVRLTPNGTFQESKDPEGNVHWQYFPNHTIDGELVTPKSVTPENVEEAFLEGKLTPEQDAAYLKHLQDVELDDGSTT